MNEPAESRVRTTTTPQHSTAENADVLTRRRWSRIRPIVFWATTIVIVAELTAGSVWNLLTIEWVEVQLHHLGYPHFLAYILGVWQAAAAVAILAPKLPLIKEWAYAGALFLWSGAVASHLSVGDGLESWWVPLMFGMCAVASWASRPADRRLPQTGLGRTRAADTGRDQVAGPPEIRARAWIAPVGFLVVLYAVSYLTLPAVEDAMHEQAVELGWIDD
ncbi:DoxX family protein [Nocardia sp. NPDC050799]|uniref:DoxX family protein n=1 Tax=Nocardia sp. NPDC050799 TaxID=3154842 RepID=UPI0033EC8ED4